MTNFLEIYKCPICGNIVQILHSGAGDLVCCGQNMELLEGKRENSEFGEKHEPQIKNIHTGCDTGVCSEKRVVSVCSHPMTTEHYIEFLEAYSKDNNSLNIKFLNPEETAEMDISHINGDIKALSYCNLHGLWRNKND